MIDPVVDQASRERIHATPSPATVPGSLPVLFFGDILSEHNEPAGVLHGLPPPLAIPAGQALAGSLGFGIVGTEDDFVDVQDANAGPPTRPGLTFASEGGAAGSDGRRRPGSYRWCDTHRDTHHAVVLDDGDGCWVMHPFGTEPACTEPGTVQWSAEGRCSGDRR